MEQQAQVQMPQYQSHKKVWALKIKEVRITSDGSMVLQFENPKFGVRGYPIEQHANRPVPIAGMYFVQYESGYFSFSPAKEFEEGYTLIGPKKRPSIEELQAILDSEEDAPIIVNPDGSITTGVQ